MALPPARKLPGILLPLSAIWLGLSPSTLDYWVQDLSGQLLAAPASEQVVIVAIDEYSLARLGRWPWPRELLADAIDRLQQARAVGLNLILAEAADHPQTDQTLADAIARHGRVFLPAFPEADGPRLRPTLPLPLLAQAARGVGISDFPPQSNGELRRTYLASGSGRAPLPSFAALLAGQALASSALRPDPRHGWVRREPRLLPYLPADSHYLVIPMVQLLTSSQPDPRLRGKTVLIGVTASGSGDEHFTAIQPGYGKSSGVFINAALVQAMQQQQLVTPLPAAWRVAVLLTLALLWQWLAHRLGGHRPLRLTAGGAALLLLADSLLYHACHLQLGVATLVAGIVLLSVGNHFLQQSHFKKLAFTDKLTGLANRHQFDERIVLALQRSQLEQRPLALLLLDVDHFKRYNDHYGHAAGDDVLRQIAQLLAGLQRHARDTAARVGGEEFALLLPDTDGTTALALAAELRYQLLTRQLPHHQSPLGRVSCSIGIYAGVPDSQCTVRQIFEQADQALYQVKRNGRDHASLAISLDPQHDLQP